MNVRAQKGRPPAGLLRCAARAGRPHALAQKVRLPAKLLRCAAGTSSNRARARAKEAGGEPTLKSCEGVRIPTRAVALSSTGSTTARLQGVWALRTTHAFRTVKFHCTAAGCQGLTAALKFHVCPGGGPKTVEARRAEIPGRPRAASQSSKGWKKIICSKF